MTRRRRVLGVALWVVGPAVAIGVLDAVGSGPLASPPLLDRAAWDHWLAERDAVLAAMAGVRLIGLALAWYLLTTTVVGGLARLSRVPALVAAIDLATVPAVRRALGAVASAGLAASGARLVAADLSPGLPPPAEVPMLDTPVVLPRLPDGADRALRHVSPDEGPRPDDDATGEGTATMRVDGEPGADPLAPRPEWVVRPGDHLWHVAETTLARAWGRPPTEEEVAPYWRAVVATNRAHLIDPANPDLIRPGQVFSLPEVPAAPA